MKILVVDDERDVEILFRQRFRKEIKSGLLNFQFAFSGEEAVEAMENMEQKAVLILSDINMPGMSGLELLERIRKEYDKPPPVVMMITAYGDIEQQVVRRIEGPFGVRSLRCFRKRMVDRIVE